MRTCSPAETLPGTRTRASRPKSWSCAAARCRSSSGHFSRVSGSRVGIAQRSHGAVDREPDAALELDRRAGPAELRPGLGVELEVEVGAEAPGVDLRAELPRERGQRARDGDEDRARHVRDAAEVALEPHGAAEVALERRAQVRVAPAPVADAGRLGDDRVRRLLDGSRPASRLNG